MYLSNQDTPSDSSQGAKWWLCGCTNSWYPYNPLKPVQTTRSRERDKMKRRGLMMENWSIICQMWAVTAKFQAALFCFVLGSRRKEKFDSHYIRVDLELPQIIFYTWKFPTYFCISFYVYATYLVSVSKNVRELTFRKLDLVLDVLCSVYEMLLCLYVWVHMNVVYGYVHLVVYTCMCTCTCVQSRKPGVDARCSPTLSCPCYVLFVTEPGVHWEAKADSLLSSRNSVSQLLQAWGCRDPCHAWLWCLNPDSHTSYLHGKHFTY